MLIAISSQGHSLDSQVDPRFGRAQYFILVDKEQGTHQVLDNRANLEAPKGAGIHAAQSIAENKAQALITGHCGPKAFDALQAGNIQVYYYHQEGTVQDAIQAFREGRLDRAHEPDSPVHRKA